MTATPESGLSETLFGPGTARRATPLLPAKEGYALWAATYDRDPNPLLALEERTLLPLLAGLRGKNALDVACGTGRWLEKLLARGARTAVGIDFSSAMLSAAAAKPSLRSRVIQADGLALPLRSGFAELVICSFAIGHFRDLGALAHELGRVTATGADCYLSDVHPAASAAGWRTGFRHAGRAIQIESASRSIEQVRAAFEGHGFTLRRSSTPSLGEPERPIFARAGKALWFDEAARLPALLIYHFVRRDSAPRRDD